MQRLAATQSIRLTTAVGLGVAVLIGGAWIALTAATGETYHLAPLLGAVGPALAVRAILGARLGWPTGLMLGGAGAVLMLGAWGLILALDIEPTATIAEGIPGEVFGEVVIGAAVGAGISSLMHTRRRSSPA